MHYQWQSQIRLQPVVLLILIVLSLVLGEVKAQSMPTDVTAQLPAFGSPERRQQLDDLYDSLRKTQEPNRVWSLEKHIWSIWLHHGDPKIDDLMSRAMTARRESNFEKAIALTDKIIQLAPNYAEGWNQRATLHFLRESYDDSLHDVAEVLRLEPNHFGALSGRGVIRMRQGKPALAIQNILEALKVNPHLQERRLLEALGYKESDT